MMSSKFNRYLIFCISVFLFAVSACVDLSRYASEFTFFYKYISLLLVFSSVFIIGKKERSDIYAMLGLFFFVLTLCLFTVINSPSFVDLAALAGYIILYIIYYFLSKSDVDIRNYLMRALVCAGVLFVFLNVPFIFDPAAYSVLKQQFKGVFDNANAFTGLSGLFFIIFLYLFSIASNGLLRISYAFFMVFLAFFLFLGFSRGALLSTGIACAYLLFMLGLRKSMFLFFLLFFSAALYFWLEISIFEAAFSRGFFEATGRESIFNSYISELYERYYFFGTGVSIESGRIKSELAYLDVFLMTGFLGMAGLLFFIFRTFYMSCFVASVDSCWLVAIYIYIITSSLFEGYIANIFSLNSILFYIVSALICGSYKSRTLWLRHGLLK